MKVLSAPKLNLSVSIVNYNAGEYLINCLSCLEKLRSEVNLDIWVVDNNSSDESIKQAEKQFPKVHFIKNSENLGFGKAHNLALKQIKSEYILILNPDTEVLPGTLSYLLDYMNNHPDVGACSSRIELDNGKMDLASHRGFPTPWASFLYFMIGDDKLYHMTDQDLTKMHFVDVISGAFFLTRKKILEEIGYFDEDYFLYAEDIDMCYRIKKLGYQIAYIPEVKAIHHKGISSGIKKHSQEVSLASIESRKKALDSFYETMKIFYKKHLESEYPFFINWLVYLGIDFKWMMARRKLTV